MTGMRDSMRMEILRSSSSQFNDNSENWDQLINDSGEQLHCSVIMRAIFSLYTQSLYTTGASCTAMYKFVVVLDYSWTLDVQYLMMKEMKASKT